MDRFSSASKFKKTSSPQEKNIQVVVRCRPRNSLEKKLGSSNVIEANTRKGEIIVHQELHDKPITKTFNFDRVYNGDSTQIEVYQGVVEPIIAEVLMGYNCTVFAYGQTGTGKTYTMEGERSAEGSLSWEEDPFAGIIPRSLHQLFKQLECQEAEYSVRVSFLELYNEELFDLLSVSNDHHKLRIFEDSTRKGGVVIQGLEEVTVHSKNEVYSILERGSQRRQTACTLLNASSSRSHTVFSVTIHIKENSLEGEELLKTGKLNLVDLAGSENIIRSGAADKRAKEAGSINQSLLTLGRCITALVEKCPHIPYRESKLTRILQDSLGGRTKTSIIATISPAHCNIDETMSTLDYAHRAKNITNRPEINQKLTKRALIREYTGEIDKLKKDLLAAREKNGIFLSPENYYGMETKIKYQTELITELEDKIKSYCDEIKKLEDMFSFTKEELQERERQLSETSHTLEQTQSSLKFTKQNLAVVKKERDETRYLVSEHIKSKEILRNEAEQLKSTVESAVGDVTGLHNKLARITSIENNNKKTATHFKELYDSNVDAMKASLQDLKLHQTDFTQSLLQSIQNWSLTQNQNIQHIQQLVCDIQSTVNESTLKHIDLIKERLHSNIEKITGLSSEQFQVDFNKACNVMLVSQLTPMISQLHETISQHSAYHESMLNTLRDKIISFDSSVTQFESNQLLKLKEMESTIKQSHDDQTKSITSIHDGMDIVLTEQNEAHKVMFDDLTTKMNEWMDNAKKTLASQWEMKMTEIKGKLHNCVENQQEKTTSLQQSVSEISDNVTSFASDSNHIWTNAIQEIDTMLTNNKSNETVEKNLLTKTQSGINSGLQSIKETANQFSDTLKVKSSDLTNALEEQTELTTASNKDHLHDLQSLTDDTCSKLTSLLGDRMNTMSLEWQKMVSDHNGHCDDSFDDSNEKLANLKEMVDNFISTELKEDIPTGVTPQRRQFIYPRMLTQTKPHQELLQDFWEKLEQVSEVDETLESNESEIESSISSTSSYNPKVEDLKENISEGGKKKRKKKGLPLQTLNNK